MREIVGQKIVTTLTFIVTTFLLIFYFFVFFLLTYFLGVLFFDHGRSGCDRERRREKMESEYYRTEAGKIAANMAEEAGWENLHETLSAVADICECLESMDLEVRVSESSKSMSHYVYTTCGMDDVCVARVSDHDNTSEALANFRVGQGRSIAAFIARIRAMKKTCDDCGTASDLTGRVCACGEKYSFSFSL